VSRSGDKRGAVQAGDASEQGSRWKGKEEKGGAAARS
jgi:hypothetical protein